MDKAEILKQIEAADKNDLNYFEILGTDQDEDATRSFPLEYFDYRDSWKSRPLKAESGDFPLHVDIESTNRCNLRCTMCQIDFDNMEQGLMDIELYKRIIAECGRKHLPSIKLNYRGEPAMNKNLPEMVRIAKEAGIIEVQMNTNGVLINEKMTEQLIEAGLDRIKFSVDGATPEIYEKIRGTPYQKTVDNIINFVKLRNKKGKKRPIVHVQMVYMQNNKEEVVDFVQFWHDIVNRIGFSRYRSPEKKLDDGQRVESKPVATIPCPQLWQRLLVTFDGKILMCCGDHKALNPLGNIKDMTLEDAWGSKKLESYRKLHLEDRSDKIQACSICEINKTDASTAKKIWEKIENNV